MAKATYLILLVLVVTETVHGTAIRAVSDCGHPAADIMFLVDSSGSVGSANFQRQKDYMASMVQSFAIGPNDIQVGVVTFASTAHNEFNLNRYITKQELIDGIQAITYKTGGTRTDLGLKYVGDSSFNSSNGNRDNVDNILIVMTDGRSNLPAATREESTRLRTQQADLEIIAIGIGSGTNKTELTNIASDPRHVYTVANFEALSTIQAELASSILPCSACTDDESDWYCGTAGACLDDFNAFTACRKTCGHC